MADAKILQPFILAWEGGYGNHPADKGGPTNKGVTLDTFRSFYGKDRTITDLKAITDEQWLHIFKKGFWDKCRADDIKSQSVANLIVDWAYHSGVSTAVKKVQQIVGVKADGQLGPVTLAAINGKNPRDLFNQIWQSRKTFLEKLGNFNVFSFGWMNRINAIGYGTLAYKGRITTFPD